MKTRFTLYLILALISISTSSCAQIRARYNRRYFTGYIITNTGDTLVGRIKSNQNFSKKVKFISDYDTLQKTQRINVNDISSMRLNLMVFERVKQKGKSRMRMFEKVAFGYYDLFAYNYQRGEVAENRYLLRLAEQTIKIEPRNFKEIAERYLFDCPEIRQKVLAKQYTFDNTVEVFRFYNRWKQTHP